MVWLWFYTLMISYCNKILQTDCFLLCYSIDSKTSYENVFSKWSPEIRHFSPHVPIVLVGKSFLFKLERHITTTYVFLKNLLGTKSDLRIHGSEKFVTTQEGKKLKSKISAYALVECSAKKKAHLTDVFEEAVRAVEKKSPHAKRSCSIL